MLDKKGLSLKVLFCTFILIGLIGLSSVVAEPPGVVNDNRITDTVEGITAVDLYVNVTSAEWVYLTNTTLYWTTSPNSSDRDIIAYNENETVDLSALDNGSSNTTQYQQIEFGSLVAGQYLHYRSLSCGENVTDWPVGAVNSTECAYSNANSTIYFNPVNYPARLPPTLDLITPTDGSNDADGLMFFNINMTSGDSSTLEGGNITILMNLTGTGDQIGCGGDAGVSCDADSNIAYVFLENMSVAGTVSSTSFLFNTTSGAINGGNLADNISIFWSAIGCSNATGNCSYATANFTNTVSYYVSESDAPVISNVQVNGVGADNGTVIATDSVNISATITDASLVDNVTLYINGVNRSGTQPNKDTLTYSENDTLSIALASITGVQFNLTEMIANETWLDNADDMGTFPQDGWISFFLTADDNESNTVYSENYTYEIDTTAPVASSDSVFTLTDGACQTATVEWLLDEPSNFSGYYYETAVGIATNTSFVSQSSFSVANTSTNMTNLRSGAGYTYNIDLTDELGNAGTGSVTGTHTFDWSLCTGWTHYGVLNTTLNFSTSATDIGADFLSTWNGTAFNTYTTASPSLGNDAVLGRGEGFLINTDSDKAWVRPTNTNTSSSGDASGTSIALNAGWTLTGLLADRTAENITYLQDPSASSSNSESNISWTSYYNNNNSEASYKGDWILARTLNANYSYRNGYGLWLYSNVTMTWDNRTGFIGF